ncbi:putative E3 ubiquitin-protein ligase IE1 [Papilio xuthus]|uniref:Putative E3 ubiquitin-protein ligase IE1 n=1 Tax=Papilio xuthus TaxID=66420 RepID=A0A194QL88_PAPXU|nr:putative E3 ubiquitin-protein ligase IE1 [Papilio xuthus]
MAGFEPRICRLQVKSFKKRAFHHLKGRQRIFPLVFLMSMGVVEHLGVPAARLPPPVFHLRDIRWERPRFLSKSFLAFVTFNVISYSLLAAEVLTTNVANTTAEKKNFYQHVFNGCYAVLLFIVVIFFLIYGVEVYFKATIPQYDAKMVLLSCLELISCRIRRLWHVLCPIVVGIANCVGIWHMGELRGEFLKETKVCTIISPRPGPSSADDDDVQDTLVTKQGIQTDLADRDGSVDLRSVDLSQLHQSRVGLVSQALMLILIAGFLASETLSEFWKTKVPVVSRNWHDVVFRLAEIGVALWFPCVLWNSMAPERLWLLNPRRLLARQLDDAKLADLLAHHHDAKNVETDSLVGSVGSARDCWICYDGSRNEPLIRPCRCTGDVSAVHHDCLRRWLIESATTPDGLKCKVCNTPYIVQKTNRVEWERGFTCTHWTRTALAVAGMCGAGVAAWLLVQVFPSPVVRVLCAGAALLVCYVAIRFLSMNTVIAYQRAKVSSLRIVTEPLAESQVNDQTQLCTISKTVTVEIASKAVLEQALKGDVKN